MGEPRAPLLLTDLLRPPARAIRSGSTKLLHPFRRRRAERSLSSGAPFRSILFLCTGNICRSPYAEKALLHVLAPDEGHGIRVASAGFLEPNRVPPEPAIRIAAERGVSLRGHLSKRIDPGMQDGWDLIIGMESGHLTRARTLLRRAMGSTLLLGDLDPLLPSRRSIRDPWGQTDETFWAVFDRIDRCVERLGSILLDSLRSHRAEAPNGERPDHGR